MRTRPYKFLPAGTIWLLVTACGGGGSGGGGSGTDNPPSPGGPGSVEAPAPQPNTFVDITDSSGITYESGWTNWVRSSHVANMTLGGVAAGDVDLDGDIDLFISRGDVGPNLLYLNNGQAQFSEAAQAAGLAYTNQPASMNYRHSGPVFADMDGDGDLDLFIGGLYGDPSFVYANNGSGTFTDVTAGSGLDTITSTNTISAAFGDYDLDGYPDLLLSHWGTHRDSVAPGDTEHLWHNDSTGPGDIRFSSVSIEAEISPSVINISDPRRDDDVPVGDWTLTPVFARINDDLYPDLLMVADYNYTQFFTNDGDGTFTNATDPNVIRDNNGMGTAVGDFDNDLDLDWFVSSIFEPGDLKHDGNRFYRNDDGVFTDISATIGIRNGAWGWGSCFMDFENDGDLDIYQTNGWPKEGFEDDISAAYQQLDNGNFSNRAGFIGLDDSDMGLGVVCADFDDDGDTDIFQTHNREFRSATLWRNDLASFNSASVTLEGRSPNTQASGARIFATINGVTQMREIMLGSNFASQNPTTQIFGLNDYPQIDELRVQWPDGTETESGPHAAGSHLRLSQP